MPNVINKATHIPNACLICPVICNTDMDSTCHQHQKTGIFSQLNINCQRAYSWDQDDHLSNTKMSECTGLPSLTDLVIRNLNSPLVM